MQENQTEKIILLAYLRKVGGFTNFDRVWLPNTNAISQ